ncbi:hypothetical protein [Frankia sp. Cj3]|uniref:hypothetical protein n=1 Tax=Frankia sp. Cj3 TaxID=2880976 RepID=UPI001EF54383|nr:hypothetical protein [Frankia sp. Cj3]
MTGTVHVSPRNTEESCAFTTGKLNECCSTGATRDQPAPNPGFSCSSISFQGSNSPGYRLITVSDALIRPSTSNRAGGCTRGAAFCDCDGNTGTDDCFTDVTGRRFAIGDFFVTDGDGDTSFG